MPCREKSEIYFEIIAKQALTSTLLGAKDLIGRSPIQTSRVSLSLVDKITKTLSLTRSAISKSSYKA